MANLKEYQAIKERVESLQSEADRSRGALGQLTSTLKRDYGCKSLAEGEQLLERLKREDELAQRKVSKAVAAFEKEFGDELGFG